MTRYAPFLTRRLKVLLDANGFCQCFNLELVLLVAKIAFYRQIANFSTFIGRLLPKSAYTGLGHTSATLLINLGIDVATVAKRLGHAQNSTTLNFYTHDISSAEITDSHIIYSLTRINEYYLP